jgi:hypothetical protein
LMHVARKMRVRALHTPVSTGAPLVVAALFLRMTGLHRAVLPRSVRRKGRS